MDSTLSRRKGGQSEEQQLSQGRGCALRDQRLLAWMKEDFDAGFGKVVEDYWRELYSWAYKLLESSGLTYLAEDALPASARFRTRVPASSSATLFALQAFYI